MKTTWGKLAKSQPFHLKSRKWNVRKASIMTVQLAGAVVASPASHRVTTFSDPQGKIVLSTAKKLVHNDSWGRAAREQGKRTMLGEIAVMLIFTFGLSRGLLYVIPNSVLGRRKITIANAGSVLLIASLYVIVVNQ
jgi:hypothetical protein